jgi:hypothetical protein
MKFYQSILKQIVLIALCIVFLSNISITGVAFAAAEIPTNASDSDVVYVKDFGAYGDGVHNDTLAINSALNSGAAVVVFDENASYKTTDCIMMKTSGVRIVGNNATLFTDNDYRSRSNYYEWYFNVVANDITIEGLNILAKETILVGYKTQFTIRLASNVVVNNCTFTVPSTVLSDAFTHDIEYSNADVYTGWHNVKITNCVFTQLADTKAGGNCGFRDIWSKGADTALFENNVCISNSHDEIFALFSSEAKISNITVNNNKFTGLDGTVCANRTVGITLGYPNNRGIEGVVFTNNTIDMKSNYSMFTLGDSTNVLISNNTVSYESLDTICTAYILRGNTLKDNNVTMAKNNISVTDNINGRFGGLISGYATFSDNTVLVNATVTNALFDSNASATKNNITVNGAAKRISTSIKELTDNSIILNNSITTMFEFYNKTFTYDTSITGNTITCNKKTDTNDALLMLNGTKLNGYLLTVRDNTITVAGDTAKTLYYINLIDTTSQVIEIANNSISDYTKTYISSKCSSICDIAK